MFQLENKKRLTFIFLVFGLLLTIPAPGLSDDSRLNVYSKLEDGVVYVEIETIIQAPHDLIWATLTDYNRLAEYIPGMNSSRLLRYEGKVAFVEQHGVSELFFLKIPVDVIVKSIERKPYHIDIELVSGNFDHLSGGYHLARSGEHLWTLSWTGYLDPSLPIPNFIAQSFIRKSIKNQFLGIIAEIEKQMDARLDINEKR